MIFTEMTSFDPRALICMHMALHPSIHTDVKSLKRTEHGIFIYECKEQDLLFNLVYHTPPSYE